MKTLFANTPVTASLFDLFDDTASRYEEMQRVNRVLAQAQLRAKRRFLTENRMKKHPAK